MNSLTITSILDELNDFVALRGSLGCKFNEIIEHVKVILGETCIESNFKIYLLKSLITTHKYVLKSEDGSTINANSFENYDCPNTSLYAPLYETYRSYGIKNLLNLPSPFEFSLLEILGKARENGVLLTDLNNLLGVKLTYNAVDKMVKLGYACKRYVMPISDTKGKNSKLNFRTNIVHLARFAHLFDPAKAGLDLSHDDVSLVSFCEKIASIMRSKKLRLIYYHALNKELDITFKQMQSLAKRIVTLNSSNPLPIKLISIQPGCTYVCLTCYSSQCNCLSEKHILPLQIVKPKTFILLIPTESNHISKSSQTFNALFGKECHSHLSTFETFFHYINRSGSEGISVGSIRHLNGMKKLKKVTRIVTDILNNFNIQTKKVLEGKNITMRLVNCNQTNSETNHHHDHLLNNTEKIENFILNAYEGNMNMTNENIDIELTSARMTNDTNKADANSALVDTPDAKLINVFENKSSLDLSAAVSTNILPNFSPENKTTKPNDYFLTRVDLRKKILLDFLSSNNGVCSMTECTLHIINTEYELSKEKTYDKTASSRLIALMVRENLVIKLSVALPRNLYDTTSRHKIISLLVLSNIPDPHHHVRIYIEGLVSKRKDSSALPLPLPSVLPSVLPSDYHITRSSSKKRKMQNVNQEGDNFSKKSKRENPILIGNLSEINPITNDYFRDDIDRAINCRSDSDLLKLLLGLKPPGLVIGSRNLHNTIFQTFIKFDDLKKKRKCIEIKMDKLLDKLSVRFVIKNYGIPVSSLSHLSKIFMGKRQLFNNYSDLEKVLIQSLKDHRVKMENFLAYQDELGYSLGKELYDHAKPKFLQHISFLVTLGILVPSSCYENRGLDDVNYYATKEKYLHNITPKFSEHAYTDSSVLKPPTNNDLEFENMYYLELTLRDSAMSINTVGSLYRYWKYRVLPSLRHVSLSGVPGAKSAYFTCEKNTNHNTTTNTNTSHSMEEAILLSIASTGQLLDSDLNHIDTSNGHHAPRGGGFSQDLNTKKQNHLDGGNDDSSISSKESECRIKSKLMLKKIKLVDHINFLWGGLLCKAEFDNVKYERDLKNYNLSQMNLAYSSLKANEEQFCDNILNFSANKVHRSRVENLNVLLFLENKNFVEDKDTIFHNSQDYKSLSKQLKTSSYLNFVNPLIEIFTAMDKKSLNCNTENVSETVSTLDPMQIANKETQEIITAPTPCKLYELIELINRFSFSESLSPFKVEYTLQHFNTLSTGIKFSNFSIITNKTFSYNLNQNDEKVLSLEYMLPGNHNDGLNHLAIKYSFKEYCYKPLELKLSKLPEADLVTQNQSISDDTATFDSFLTNSLIQSKNKGIELLSFLNNDTIRFNTNLNTEQVLEMIDSKVSAFELILFDESLFSRLFRIPKTLTKCLYLVSNLNFESFISKRSGSQTLNYPWKFLNGGINKLYLNKLRSSILSHLMTYPGSTINSIQKSLTNLTSHQLISFIQILLDAKEIYYKTAFVSSRSCGLLDIINNNSKKYSENYYFLSSWESL